jgi:hypothetical protein
MTHLWLKEVQFSELTFVLKSPPIANLQNVMGKFSDHDVLTKTQQRQAKQVHSYFDK